MNLFDESDCSSYYLGNVSFDETVELLANKEVGSFFLRDSSRGGLVLCVKEKNTVSQFPIVCNDADGNKKLWIREDCPFEDLPSLLSFYKMNLFRNTALRSPITVDQVPCKKGNNCSNRNGILSGYFSSPCKSSSNAPKYLSAPAALSQHRTREEHSNKPVRARVTKPYHRPYFEDYLTLNVGDILVVSKSRDGIGEGILNGKKGKFPLANVEVIRDQ